MIHIIHFSDGHKHFTEPIREYEKRTSKQITIHTLKPVKHTQPEYIREKETEKLLEKIAKFKGNVYICDENGKHIKTQDFSDIIRNAHNTSEDMIFVIGGSYGINIYKIQEKMKDIHILKLSEMVMPHGLAFLVLIEQIYRSFEIIK